MPLALWCYRAPPHTTGNSLMRREVSMTIKMERDVTLWFWLHCVERSKPFAGVPPLESTHPSHCLLLCPSCRAGEHIPKENLRCSTDCAQILQTLLEILSL